MVFFTFPDDAAWNTERRAVEFGIEIGGYQGRVFAPRSLFQTLLTSGKLDEATCLATFYAYRMIFERAAEQRIIRCQLDPDGHITLKTTDLMSEKSGPLD